jgi:hypothetical protein
MIEIRRKRSLANELPVSSNSVTSLSMNSEEINQSFQENCDLEHFGSG